MPHLSITYINQLASLSGAKPLSQLPPQWLAKEGVTEAVLPRLPETCLGYIDLLHVELLLGKPKVIVKVSNVDPLMSKGNDALLHSSKETSSPKTSSLIMLSGPTLSAIEELQFTIERSCKFLIDLFHDPILLPGNGRWQDCAVNLMPAHVPGRDSGNTIHRKIDRAYQIFKSCLLSSSQQHFPVYNGAVSVDSWRRARQAVKCALELALSLMDADSMLYVNEEVIRSLS